MKMQAHKFDQLMDQAFLALDLEDPKNDLVLQGVSRNVMGNGLVTVPSGNFLKTMIGKIGLNTILAFIGSVTLIISAYTLLGSSVKMPEPLKPSAATPMETIVPAEKKQSPAISLLPSETKPLGKKTSATTNSSMPAQVILLPDSPVKAPVDKMETPGNNKEIIPVTATNDSMYVFPKLTEQEIKTNNKQKKKMVEQAARCDKSRYAAIPAASKFYMHNSEVTNQEYRTFIFDLLIQGKKEEFLKAKPDQHQWVKETDRKFFSPMEENYFSHSAYDTYPVVNVSREGAEMYCEWLEQEANKLLTAAGKPALQIGLPTDKEWIYAANSGIADAHYAWGPTDVNDTYISADRNKASNKRGCFLANFCLRKYHGDLDSMSACNAKAHKQAYTTAGMMLGEGTATAPVYSYNANLFGLYCVCGNVAEMVTTPAGPGTKGGGWNSDEEHIRIDGDDEYAGRKGPSPFIGFRVLVR